MGKGTLNYDQAMAELDRLLADLDKLRLKDLEDIVNRLSILDICKIYQYIDKFGNVHLDFSAINGIENPSI